MSSWCHCHPETHHLLPHLNPDWFYLSGTGLPRLSWKKRLLNGRSSGSNCFFVYAFYLVAVLVARFSCCHVTVTILHLCYYSSSASRGAEYCGEHVCLSVVHVFVHEQISGTTRAIFAKCFVYVVYVEAGSSICYALPVLWMTSYLRIIGHMGACQYCCSEWGHCVVVRRLRPLLRRFGCVLS